MKKVKLLFGAVLLALISTTGYAQAPESFNYQAVLRNADGSIIANQSVVMQFAVRTGDADGTVQYNEEQTLTTNEFGLVDHAVGTGTAITGNFSNISWDAAPKFLQVQLDDGGGLVDIGTQRLMSVPYALNAKTADALTGGIPSSGWNASGNNISNSNSGNVGIGTTSPIQKLDVNGRMNVNSGVIQRGGSAITATNDLGLYSRVVGNFVRLVTNNAPIVFYTDEGTNGTGGAAARMVIAANGNVGIGTSLDPTSKLVVNGGTLFGDTYQDPGNSPWTQSNCQVILGGTHNLGFNQGTGGDKVKLLIAGYDNDNSATLYPIFLEDENGTNDFWVRRLPNEEAQMYLGSSTAYKPGGGSWTAWSDSRLKKDISPFEDGLSSVLAINPVKFRYNEKLGVNSEKEHIGIIAQELKEIAPYMVGNFEHEGTDYLDVDNSAMTYMLINAVKEQQEQIDALKAEIETLKNR